MRDRLLMLVGVGLLVAAVVLCLCATAGAVAVRVPGGPPSRVDAETRRVPASPPTTTAAPAAPDPAAATEQTYPGTSQDLLRNNGLVSPWCVLGPLAITAVATDNCETSGLQSISGSGDQIGFDRHVDTGGMLGTPDPAGTFNAYMLNILSLVWAGMVMVTKVLFLALEFTLGFNPLDARHGGFLGPQLARELRTITFPLAAILAPAGGVWFLWTAAAHRRHGEAIKHLALGFLLYVACIVVLLNPVGTVGAAMTMSQKVGLGVIGAVSDARPGGGTASTQSGLRAMGDSIIERPLALLQFGDVDWGTNPQRLDPGLREAAIALADDDPKVLERVRSARTNMRLFEAWPAGAPERNSINDDGSLLAVMCQSDDDTDCHGPNAQRAEFRTGKGLWQRIVALLVIAMGMVPFWAVLGYVAFKLLGASLMCMVRLLQLVFIAPLALTGKAGTQRIVSYGGDFFGAVFSYAAYSFFLAVVMSMWRLITSWPGYGFVLQWLLLAAALLLMIVNRKRLWGTVRQSNGMLHGSGIRTAGFLAMAMGRSAMVRRSSARAGSGGAARRTQPRVGAPAGRVGSVAGGVRPGGRPGPRAGEAAGAAGGTVPAAAGTIVPGVSPGVVPPTDRQVQQAKRGRAQQVTAARAAQLQDYEQARAQVDVPALRTRAARLRGELTTVNERLEHGQTTPRQREQLRRRRASLHLREQRVSGAVVAAEQRQRALDGHAADPRKARMRTAQVLDHASRLPPGAGVATAMRLDRTSAIPDRRHRDYAALAGLAGSTPRGYRAAPAHEQLRMRSRVDRELAKRGRDLHTVKASRTGGAGPSNVPGSPPAAGSGRAPRTGARRRPRPSSREAFRHAAAAEEEP